MGIALKFMTNFIFYTIMSGLLHKMFKGLTKVA